MIWIIVSIMAGLCWALSQHIDKYLIVKYFKDTGIGGLVLFSSFIALPVIFIIFLFQGSNLSLNPSEIFVLITAGMIYLLAIVLYLYAMESDDVLMVGPLSQFTPIITAVLAYLFLNEKLTVMQVIGGLIIMFGGLVLNSERSETGKMNIKLKNILLMLGSCFFMSLNALMFKVVAINAEFWTTIFWEQVGWLVLGTIFVVFIKEYRLSFLHVFKKNSFRVLSINFTNEVITLIGNFFFHYATILTLMALAEIVAEGSQPVFLILLDIIIIRFFIKNSEERNKILNVKYLLHKGASVLIMIVGLVLLNNYN